MNKCTLVDIVRWRDFGGTPDFAVSAVENESYLVYKHQIRHKPIVSLDDIPEVIEYEVSRICREIPGLYLTGSWFLGTYFDETDDPRWLSFREQLHKPRHSDIDFWHPQYTDEMRAEIKSMIKSFKLDLIKGWWGNGINLTTGEVMKCR